MDGRRSALIVANDRYQDPRLRQLRAPTQDAQALARVLSDPVIGNFDVKVVTNEPEHRLRREIATFFADRERNDLLLTHLSCHGVKDDSGQLYFATADTELRNLDATALPADFVNRHMTRSRSRRVVLLLDCCYSGAFARGMVHRADTKIDLGDRFEGRGRIVLTASSAMEYAFEDVELSRAAGRPSLFTSALVQGLQTGDADRDGDGRISVDELYDYVFEEVRKATPNQTPGRWDFDLQGDFLIAHSGRVRPCALPGELQQAVSHPVAGARLGAVEELERLLNGAHPGFALAAREALDRLRRDDSQRVSVAAATALAGARATGPALPPAAEVKPPPGREQQPTRRAVQRPPRPPASRPAPPPRPPTPAAPAASARPPAGTPGTPGRPVWSSRPRLLLVLVPLACALLALAFDFRPGRPQQVRVGERFEASSPWRLQVHGANCAASLTDAYGASVVEGYGSDYVLQLRATGAFRLAGLSAGCRAAVVPGAGRTADLPLSVRAGVGGDTPPFQSTGGFRITVAGTSCHTVIFRSGEGSEVDEFDGSENTEIDQSGAFYVRADARCSVAIAPA